MKIKTAVHSVMNLHKHCIIFENAHNINQILIQKIAHLMCSGSYNQTRALQGNQNAFYMQFLLESSLKREIVIVLQMRKVENISH